MKGIVEVIVVDRDTKQPEVFRLLDSQYVAIQPDREGWIPSEMLKVRLARRPAGRLAIEDADDPATRTEI
jgi:Uma2 family endonuclease